YCQSSQEFKEKLKILIENEKEYNAISKNCVNYFASNHTTEKIVDKYGVEMHYRHDLIAVDGKNKTATFKVTDNNEVTKEITKHFDMLHITPPQSAPDFIAQSPLASDKGWVDVDKYTLQHTRYKNIFSYFKKFIWTWHSFKYHSKFQIRHKLLYRFYRYATEITGAVCFWQIRENNNGQLFSKDMIR
ncbi:MAG: NAD(P)/FAD-dependent oxidoreductase, partial [Chlorobiaceae bacterium]|nr:NAD(P)/FAD-dependent oxidoreductase [Chlorobiaceae bacterium]